MIKLASPLPNIEGVYQCTAKALYKSMLDMQSAFEQQRVESQNIYKTATTTPDSNIESLVVQQGNCNAPASYQALTHVPLIYTVSWHLPGCLPQ